MGERVNGIHEVRGSIPLASIRLECRDGAAPERLVATRGPRLHCGAATASRMVR